MEKIKAASPTQMTVKYDLSKLKVALTKRNTNLADASTALGHTRSYLSSMHMKCGYLPISTAILLEKLYDIDRSEYSVEPEKKEEKTKSSEIDMDALYKTIYSAVYNGLKQAWNDLDKVEEK